MAIAPRSCCPLVAPPGSDLLAASQRQLLGTRFSGASLRYSDLPPTSAGGPVMPRCPSQHRGFAFLVTLSHGRPPALPCPALTSMPCSALPAPPAPPCPAEDQVRHIAQSLGHKAQLQRLDSSILPDTKQSVRPC